MKIVKNMLIEFIGASTNASINASGLIERVIDISPDGEQIVTMDIYTDTGFPKVRLRSRMEEAYDNGDFRILSIDPKLKLPQPESQIPARHRQIRDDAYLLVAAVLKEAGEGIYLESRRGQAIRKVAAKEGKPEKTIYFNLRKFWQGGCVENALLPDYSNCGGKGKRRFAEVASAPKLGRPKDSTKQTGKRYGVRITKHTESLFSQGINEFYLTEKRRRLKDAFKKTLLKYFNLGYKPDADGVPVPVMPDVSQLPSFNQFRYWYRKYKKNKKTEHIARYGETDYNLTARDLLGDSTSLASGPGAVYMIDATIADVYLVSGFDRKRIIGRPVVYLIMDVFSRMIVGFAVTLEGPSWLGACLALDNMVADKVEVCKRVDITIQPEDWNCAYLPEAIFADRGEFEGYNADVLVSAFGIRVHNTAPYRGDMKGIIERAFGIANEKFIHFMPGQTHKRRRGEKPNALDATHTLDDFRYLLINHILEHNNGCEMSTYRPEKALIADNVPLRPNLIWDWGIRNRSGHLRGMLRDIVRLNLLPRKKVTIYQEGIHLYKNVFYIPPPDLSFGSNEIEIAYDPDNLDVVYIPSSDGKNAWVSPLTPACAPTYTGHTFEEVRDKFAVEKSIAAAGENQALATIALSTARQEKRSEEAARKTAEAWTEEDDQSDKSGLGGIRRNRKEERKKERESNSLSPGSQDIPATEVQIETLPKNDVVTAEIIAAFDDDEKQFVPKPKFGRLLKKAIDKKHKETD